MPDSPATIDSRLVRDLREYFALTTSVPMPRGVTGMSAATLSRKRGLSPRLLWQAGALLTTAAVAVVGFALVRGGVNHGGGASLGSAGYGAAAQAPKAAAGGTVTYPGVDSGILGTAGRTSLLSPQGHGTAVVSAVAAQAAAVAAEGAGARAAGPAVLAWVESSAGPAPLTCLCWVVEVVPAPTASTDGAGSGAPSAPLLVFVDASTGAVDGAVAAPPRR